MKYRIVVPLLLLLVLGALFYVTHDAPSNPSPQAVPRTTSEGIHF